MSTLFIPLGLACIMVTVGLGLALDDFRAIARRPVAVAAGVVAQVLALPLLAVAVATILGLGPLAAVGLVLIACVPGGVTSNFVTMLARGDTALSVVLTALTTTLGMLTVPLVLGLAIAWFDPEGVVLPAHVPLFGMVRAVLVVTVLPMATGMVLRSRFPLTTERLLPAARGVATGLFIAIVVLAFVRDWALVEAGWRSAGTAVVLFNALAVGGGLALGWALQLGARATLTLGTECGLQNVALALFVGGGVLGVPALMVPAVLYVLAMNASALVLVAVGRRVTEVERTSSRVGSRTQ